MNLKAKILYSFMILFMISGCDQKGKLQEKTPNSDENIMQPQTFILDKAIEEVKAIHQIDLKKQDALFFGKARIDFTNKNGLEINHKAVKIDTFSLDEGEHWIYAIELKSKMYILITTSVPMPPYGSGIDVIIEVSPDGKFKKVENSEGVAVGLNELELVKSSVKIKDDQTLQFKIKTTRNYGEASFEIKNNKLSVINKSTPDLGLKIDQPTEISEGWYIHVALNGIGMSMSREKISQFIKNAKSLQMPFVLAKLNSDENKYELNTSVHSDFLLGPYKSSDQALIDLKDFYKNLNKKAKDEELDGIAPIQHLLKLKQNGILQSEKAIDESNAQ